MTYQYDKKAGWIGFCNQCEQPFKPDVVCVSVYLDDNEKGLFKKVEFGKTRKKFDGYCQTCLGSKDNKCFGIKKNLDDGILKSTKVGGAVVV